MRIILNKNFYKPFAIKKAIRAYCGLADFRVRNGKDSYVVILSKINPAAEEMIEGEFLNYVLAATKDRQ